MKYRRIYLFTDEEIAVILSGIYFIRRDYVSKTDTQGVVLCDSIRDKIGNCYEMAYIMEQKGE